MEVKNKARTGRQGQGRKVHLFREGERYPVCGQNGWYPFFTREQVTCKKCLAFMEATRPKYTD